MATQARDRRAARSRRRQRAARRARRGSGPRATRAHSASTCASSCPCGRRAPSQVLPVHLRGHARMRGSGGASIPSAQEQSQTSFLDLAYVRGRQLKRATSPPGESTGITHQNTARASGLRKTACYDVYVGGLQYCVAENKVSYENQRDGG